MKLFALHEIEHSHGTVHLISRKPKHALFDNGAIPHGTTEGTAVKHKEGTSIVLVPQPTSDPNDPLVS